MSEATRVGLSPRTARAFAAGPAGRIELAIDRPEPAVGAPRGLVVVCHPHPQGGGTLDNKVAHTIARAFLQLGWAAVRFNFRGVGESDGEWDDGRGEIDDALAVIAHARAEFAGLPLALGGFSFGGYVAAAAAARLPEGARAMRLALVAPSTEQQDVPPVPADSVVVHGDADDTVPLAATLAWAKPQALAVVVMPGAGHFFHGQISWLKNTLVRELHDLAAV